MVVRTVATPREQLGEILKQARIAAGYNSHTAMARAMRVSRPVVSKAENPLQPVPSVDVLASWSRVTGVPLDKLTDLAKRCKSGTPEWFAPYKGREGEATTIYTWSPFVVPGLFQTADYARALIATEPHTPDLLQELVDARMERQKVIGKAYLVAVIDARVINDVCLGSPLVMAEQCGHLVTLASRPDVDLHVLPKGRNTGLSGGFDIAENGGTAIVRLDAAIQDVTSTANDVIERASRRFSRLAGLALPPDETIEQIRQAQERWKAEMT